MGAESKVCGVWVVDVVLKVKSTFSHHSTSAALQCVEFYLATFIFPTFTMKVVHFSTALIQN